MVDISMPSLLSVSRERYALYYFVYQPDWAKVCFVNTQRSPPVHAGSFRSMAFVS